MTEANDVADWWRTKIIDMEPGRIHLRGQPVQDLIGNTGFAQMIWLMVVARPFPAPVPICSKRRWFRRSITVRKPRP